MVNFFRDEKKESKENLTQYGGYILSDSEKENCNLIIIATGSEVEIALDVQKKLHVLFYYFKQIMNITGL